MNIFWGEKLRGGSTPGSDVVTLPGNRYNVIIYKPVKWSRGAIVVRGTVLY